MLKLHRGRLIDHVQIVSKDIAASKRFYEAIFLVLNIPIGGKDAEHFWADELFVSSTRFDPAASEPTGPVHLAFQTTSPEMVDDFYKVGLGAGGQDDGKPGERKQYHPGYYAAYLKDPDGNYIEAVFHGPANRSSDSIEITWE